MPILKEDHHISDRFLTLFAAVKTGILKDLCANDQERGLEPTETEELSIIGM